MPDVIIVGGGLSGLAAAWELEQQNIPFTLIEVKGRLGGSIISERRGGFVLDGGPFILYQSRPWAWLDALGLGDALFTVGELPNGSRLVAFKNGTQTLIDALVARLRVGRVMPRMAVSTLGHLDKQFGVCLENGMVIQAAALIVAAPARYAERLFYTFVPEISQRLLEFHYDTVTRISLGYPIGAIPVPVQAPPDTGFAFGRWTDNPHRVPPGHVLVQIGVRFPLPRTTPENLIAELRQNLKWSADPVVARVDFWPESHCLSAHDPEHGARMRAIDALLPDGVALIGSDYRGWQVEDRVEQGQQAARRIAAWLRG
jgi:protoporphyrinogen oxidase